MQKLLYLFTRTPLHIGAGTSVGAIDQPIQRERHTGFPIIPGSSIKGVFRDAFGRGDDVQNRVNSIFGKQDEAGKLTFGEAKLLAFPVRSAKGSFAFVTCPLALERLRREHGGMDKLQKPILKAPEEPGDMSCLAGDQVTIHRTNETGVVLEEYRFQRTGKFPEEWEAALLDLIEDEVWKVGKGRFVLLNNGDFSHFVMTATDVSQHVAIDDVKGTAIGGALFNLEAVPAETFFFATLTSTVRANGEMDYIGDLTKLKPVFQFGGDSTTGLGFCSVKLA